MSWNEERYSRKLEEIIKGWSESYRERAREASALMIANIHRGMRTRDAINKALSDSEFDEGIRESLLDGLIQALADGYGILPKFVNIPSVRQTLLHIAWNADGLNLSERLHGTGDEIRRIVAGTIRASMKNGESCVAMARRLYDGYGYGNVIKNAELPKYLRELEAAARRVMSKDAPEEWKEYKTLIKRARRNIDTLAEHGAPTQPQKAAYKALLRAAEDGSKRALDSAVRLAVEERSRYYAERIARTEMARAYTEGYHAKYDGDPDVVGYKWTLGTRHPHYDICDFHATADLYGMGAGVYPKESCPALPAHPHCLCRLTEVFIDEAKPGKFNPKKGREFLEKLSDGERKALLSVRGNESFKMGGDWRRHLRGWVESARPFWNRFDARSFDLQLFAFDPEQEREKIKSGYYSKTVSPQKQARHIEGTKEYERYCKAWKKQSTQESRGANRAFCTAELKERRKSLINTQGVVK